MDQPRRKVRVLIVAEHASARFGGEAILPLHYFRILRRRGIEAWLVVHSRTRAELAALLPGEFERISFIPDARLHRLSCRLGWWLPARLSYITTGYLIRLSSQWMARRVVKRLVAEHRIDVVHQPIPVSPKESSLMYDLGAPVVMGPMNGGMSYPSAFPQLESRLTALVMKWGRRASPLLNWLMPGKLRAETLLVANERTRRALPAEVRGEVITLVENGVDLSTWTLAENSDSPEGCIRFIFVGRLIDWKGVDLLLEAFQRAAALTSATLDVIGDGPLRRSLEDRARALGLDETVRFAGWLPQAECAGRLQKADVLVLPSLYECGGAVVLEAMAGGLPVVATNWGGPADYLDASCGILVNPDSRESFIAGLAEAMTRLASSPSLRQAMGQAGRQRVERHFDWEQKVDQMLDIYGKVAAKHGAFGIYKY